jgi:hypothetical protein
MPKINVLPPRQLVFSGFAMAFLAACTPPADPMTIAPPRFDAPVPRVVSENGEPYRIALAYNVARRDGSYAFEDALPFDAAMPDRHMLAFASINTDAFRDAGFELVSADAPRDADVTVYLGENPESDRQIFATTTMPEQWLGNAAKNFMTLGLADLGRTGVFDAIYAVEVETPATTETFLRTVQYLHSYDYNRFDLSPEVEELQAFDDTVTGALQQPITELMPRLEAFLRENAS